MDCMESSSTTLQLQVGSRQRPNSYDFISQMPEDVLVHILSLMPIKDAVTTSGLATRWRYKWRKLRQLNFYGPETFLKEGSRVFRVASKDELERQKYINHVNSVIRSYNHPKVKDFRISYGLNRNHKEVIDNWLEFAVEREVEFLELDLLYMCDHYDFPSTLFTQRFPNMGVVLSCLKKLILNNVNLTNEIFHELLKQSPLLEIVSIRYPRHLDRIQIDRRARNLKHFKIERMCYVDSISFSDLELIESFTYNGSRLELHFVNLPNLKKLELDIIHMNLNNVLGQISSCAFSLQYLSISTSKPEEHLILESVPELPNLKKLRLAVGGSKNEFLLFLTSILNACPNLETLSIEPCWTSPIIRRKKAKDATNHHKHLKIVEIEEYKGRRCDFELAAYIMQSFVLLKKVVITISRDFVKKEHVQTHAKVIESIKPKGLELVIV